jgi:hypothetical protein
LDEVAGVMFEVCELPWELIICLLDVLKNDFGEDDEALFQAVELSRELIFCFVGIEKNDLDEVE